MLGWKTVSHGICKWPLCDRAQLWIFYLNIFGSPNAKMTPAHAFEVIKMYSVSLQEKQLLLGTAVGICIKKPSGLFESFFNPSVESLWSGCRLCGNSALGFPGASLASTAAPHSHLLGQNSGSLSIPAFCWKGTQLQGAGLQINVCNCSRN